MSPPPANPNVIPTESLTSCCGLSVPHPQGARSSTRRSPSNISAFRTAVVGRIASSGSGLDGSPDPQGYPCDRGRVRFQRRRDRERDYEEKRREYLALGVREYWIIDRFDRDMTVYRRQPESLESDKLVIKEHEVYNTSLLPGFELPLARLLKVADDWVQPRQARKGRGQGSPPR